MGSSLLPSRAEQESFFSALVTRSYEECNFVLCFEIVKRVCGSPHVVNTVGHACLHL
jgi:hypothetical protein